MIKIAVCDDELSALNEVNALLDRYCAERNRQIDRIEFQSPLDLLAEIEKGIYLDILLLDVVMPGENGISVAREIRQYDNRVKIIFLTSSSEFAVESYTVGAFFYLMKPIYEEDFFRMMDSVISECEKAHKNDFVVPCKGGVTRINVEKLVYCEVMGRTLLFYLENGEILESTGSMDELCGKLAQYENFLRPHRSFLVNMEYIQTISYKAITMDNLAKIPIPHGKCSEIKNLYLEYVFHRKPVFNS